LTSSNCGVSKFLSDIR